MSNLSPASSSRLNLENKLASIGLSTTSPSGSGGNTSSSVNQSTLHTPSHRSGNLQVGSPVSAMYQLGERFSGIYNDIESAAMHRKEIEENKLGLLREGIVKLEKNLNAEVKRRQEQDKALQTMFDSRMAALESKVDSQFKELNQAMMAGIEVLTRRMGLVERELAQEKEQRPKEMENSTNELVQHVEILQNAFELEKVGRLETEASMVKRHTEEMNELRSLVAQEKEARAAVVQDLKKTFDIVAVEKQKTDEDFQRSVTHELSNLKQAIQVEGEIRESSEGQIVKAIGDLVVRMQDGMHVMAKV